MPGRAHPEPALTALGKLPESRETTEQGIDVRLELRPPLLQLGHLPKVLAVSQQAENMAKLIGDEARLARVYSYLINYHYLKGEPETAIAYGERGAGRRRTSPSRRGSSAPPRPPGPRSRSP